MLECDPVHSILFPAVHFERAGFGCSIRKDEAYVTLRTSSYLHSNAPYRLSVGAPAVSFAY